MTSTASGSVVAQEKIGVSDILTLHMKLEELENKLATQDRVKDMLVGSIKDTRASILPIRLELNNFIHLVGSIDEDKNGATPVEKFSTIRTALLKLYSSIQALSGNFEDLGPLFDTISQYTIEHKSKEYQPLEVLSNSNMEPISMNTTTTTATTTATATATGAINNLSSNTPTISTNNNNTGNKRVRNTSTGANTSTNSAVMGSTNSKANTPSSTVGTTTKKPRKPRQSKKSASAASSKNTPKQPISSGLTPIPMNLQQPIQTPSAATAMNPTISMPSQLINGALGMSPNIMGTPMNTMMSPQQAQQVQFNIDNSNANGNGNRSNSTSIINNKPNSRNSNVTANTTPSQVGQTQNQNQLNLNNITPANILNMNMNMNMNMNTNSNTNMAMNMPSNNNNNNNNSNTGANAMNDFGNLDLQNIDLSSLNIDFL